MNENIVTSMYTSGWTKPRTGLLCIHPVVYQCTDQNAFFRALMYFHGRGCSHYEITEDRSVPVGEPPVRAIGFLVTDGLTQEAYQVDMYNVDPQKLDPDLREVFGSWDTTQSLETFMLAGIWDVTERSEAEEFAAFEESLRGQRHERSAKMISDEKVQEYREATTEVVRGSHGFQVLGVIREAPKWNLEEGGK